MGPFPMLAVITAFILAARAWPAITFDGALRLQVNSKGSTLGFVRVGTSKLQIFSDTMTVNDISVPGKLIQTAVDVDKISVRTVASNRRNTGGRPMYVIIGCAGRCDKIMPEIFSSIAEAFIRDTRAETAAQLLRTLNIQVQQLMAKDYMVHLLLAINVEDGEEDDLVVYRLQQDKEVQKCAPNGLFVIGGGTSEVRHEIRGLFSHELVANFDNSQNDIDIFTRHGVKAISLAAKKHPSTGGVAHVTWLSKNEEGNWFRQDQYFNLNLNLDEWQAKNAAYHGNLKFWTSTAAQQVGQRIEQVLGVD